MGVSLASYNRPSTILDIAAALEAAFHRGGSELLHHRRPYRLRRLLLVDRSPRLCGHAVPSPHDGARVTPSGHSLASSSPPGSSAPSCSPTRPPRLSSACARPGSLASGPGSALAHHPADHAHRPNDEQATGKHVFGTLKAWMRDAVPHEGARQRENRDEPGNPGLKHEADDPPVRHRQARRSHPSLNKTAASCFTRIRSLLPVPAFRF